MSLFTSARRRLATVALAAGALLVSGCSVYDLPLPGGADSGKNPMTVKVKFRDVLDLVPQSTVKVDDVTVGKVKEIALQGYTAVVSLELPRDLDLPDNTYARIRQTSLLGEKFVSLEKPETPAGKLSDGDVISLENSGRNPEVEEVFSALALLLNGGGVGQLKTISQELNTALEGREGDVKSVIRQVRSFMGQLDRNKGAIITALENVNRLSLQLRRQDGTIKQALDEIPAALRSVDSQRKDLVRMLKALNRLSGVGVEVIQASKASTVETLKNLAPVLHEFAEAGDALPRALQVFLTYPFVDEAVGRDPVVARNLHMGDYVNLSARLDVDLDEIPQVGLPSLNGTIAGVAENLLDGCKRSPASSLCQPLQGVIDQLLAALPQTAPVSLGGNGGGNGTQGTTSTQGGGTGLLGGSSSGGPSSGGPSSGGNGGSGGGLLGGVLGGLGLGRTAPGFDTAPTYDPFRLEERGVDPHVGTLLLQGVAVK